MLRRAAFALALLPLPAQAMLEPCHYDEALRAATIVVQVAPVLIGGPDDQGWCAVEATVLRSFAGSLAEGDRLTTTLPCQQPEGLVGPVHWQDLAALNAAPVLELHLNADLSVAGHGAGLRLLEAATKVPALVPGPACD
jgi:hypothetical protein